MIIGVDCDMTVVDTGIAWIEWLNKSSKDEEEYRGFHDLMDKDGLIDYYVGGLFNNLKFGIDPMDFWRNKYLYHTLRPLSACEEVLQRQHQKGNDIVFISTLTGQHGSSKYDFLKHYFPYLNAVVFTKEKWAVKCDVLIDDRSNVLNTMPEDVHKIRLHTPYRQSEPDHQDTEIVYDWYSVEGSLNGLSFR